MLLSPPRRYRHENAELWDLLLRSQRRIAEIKLKAPPPPPTPPIEDDESVFTSEADESKESDEISLADEASVMESEQEWPNEKLDFDKVSSSAETVKNFLGINNKEKCDEEKCDTVAAERDFDQERREILALLQLCKRRLEYDFQAPEVGAVADSDSVTVTTDTSTSSSYSSISSRSRRRRRKKRTIQYIPEPHHSRRQAETRIGKPADIYLDKKLAEAILYLCKATQSVMVSAVETVAEDLKEETKELIGKENMRNASPTRISDDIPYMGEGREESVKYLWGATQNVLSNVVETAAEEFHLQTVAEEFRCDFAAGVQKLNGKQNTMNETPIDEIEDIPYLEDENLFYLWDATRNFMSDAVKTAAKEFKLQTM